MIRVVLDANQYLSTVLKPASNPERIGESRAERCAVVLHGIRRVAPVATRTLQNDRLCTLIQTPYFLTINTGSFTLKHLKNKEVLSMSKTYIKSNLIHSVVTANGYRVKLSAA